MSASRLGLVGEIDLTLEEVDHRDRHDPEFDRLYAEYSHRIIGLVRRFISDEDVVDDIVQETFLRAYSAELHLEYLDESAEHDQWPWLAAVARNLSLDNLRRRRLVREEGFDGEFLELGFSPDDPELLLLASRRRAGIAEALSAICPRQRRILVLKEVHGLQCRDIADREGVSVPALKSALARARRTFREAYGTIAERGGLGVTTGGILTRVQTRLRAWRDRVLTAPDALANAVAASPAAANALATLAVLGTVGALGAALGSGGGASDPARIASVSSPLAPRIEVLSQPASSSGVSAATSAPGDVGIEPTPPVAEPTGPASAPATGSSGGGTEAGASVDTDDVVPVQNPPASGSASGSVSGDEDALTLQFDRAIDADGDGKNDLSDGQTWAGVECPPPEERGAATSVACPALDGASSVPGNLGS